MGFFGGAPKPNTGIGKLLALSFIVYNKYIIFTDGDKGKFIFGYSFISDYG